MSNSKPTGRETAHLFSRKPGPASNHLTSERIEADLAAFRKAGGKVEVLGTTHTLKKLSEVPAQAATQPARPSSGGRRSGGR